MLHFYPPPPQLSVENCLQQPPFLPPSPIRISHVYLYLKSLLLFCFRTSFNLLEIGEMQLEHSLAVPLMIISTLETTMYFRIRLIVLNRILTYKGKISIAVSMQEPLILYISTSMLLGNAGTIMVKV